MKLCFSTLACPNWSLPQIVGAAAAHGIPGFDPRGIGTEIDITRLARFNGELDATLEFLGNHGLQMPCLNTSITLIAPAADRWEMMLDECHRYASLAARTGSRFLRIFAGAIPRGMTRDQSISMSHRHLRQLEKICSPHRCQVILETHDDWAASEYVLELVKDFSVEEVGILWDIEHSWHQGESPAQTAHALRARILHVHIKDVIRRDGKSLPCLLGEGELPLPEMLRALREINYDRWICLETEKRWHLQAAPEPEQSLPQFVQYMKEHWDVPCEE